MLQKIKIIIFSLLMTACGADINDYWNGIINGRLPSDEEFNSIIKDFEKKYHTKIYMPVIFSDDVPSDASGICIMQNKNIWTVKIKNTYRKRSKEDLKLLVFHELGHCALNREHSFKLYAKVFEVLMETSDGRIIVLHNKLIYPNSLMWPNTVSFFATKLDKNLKNHYFHELNHEGQIPEDAVEEYDFSTQEEAQEKLSSVLKLTEENNEENCSFHTL